MSDDLISRAAAIDTVAKWFYDAFGIRESDGTATIFKRLRSLPAAQERKKGKWIYNERYDDYKCTVCGQHALGRYNYCPDCGAEMKGEEDDERRLSKQIRSNGPPDPRIQPEG